MKEAASLVGDEEPGNFFTYMQTFSVHRFSQGSVEIKQV